MRHPLLKKAFALAAVLLGLVWGLESVSHVVAERAGRMRSRIGFAALLGRENFFEKALTEAFERFFDAADIADVVADTEDHDLPLTGLGFARSARASSISVRMRRTAFDRPPKMASPIRK